MTDKVKQKYVKSVFDLSDALDLSRITLHKWKRRPGFPKKGAKGWSVLKVHEFIYNEKQKAIKDKQGPDGDLRTDKLRLEIDMLQVKLDVLRGDAIPLNEYNRELSEYAAMVNGVFDQWLDQVSSTTRDAKLVANAERLINRAKQRLANKINETN